MKPKIAARLAQVLVWARRALTRRLADAPRVALFVLLLCRSPFVAGPVPLNSRSRKGSPKNRKLHVYTLVPTHTHTIQGVFFASEVRSEVSDVLVDVPRTQMHAMAA